MNLMVEPIVQYGFLGFCAVLIAIVVWLIQQLIDVLRANQKVVAANTASNQALIEMVSDLRELDRAMHNKLISRPCIARGET